jgi:hypothetical protein
MSAATDDLVTELARDAVARTAPEELPLFRAASAAYLEDPEAAAAGTGARGDALGFGAEAAMALVTPVALAVSTDVLRFLRAEVAKHAREQGADAIAGVVRKLFKRFRDEDEIATAVGDAQPDTALPGLSPEQLEEVHRIAVEKARSLRLSSERAELLADSIVGELVVAG